MNFLVKGCREALRKQEEAGLVRAARTWRADKETLNLADNDYLSLASHPEVKAAACEAIERYGCSSSSAPLVTGFRPPHKALVNRLAAWYDVNPDQVMLWNTGYSANHGIMGVLPKKGDLVLTDRLVHHSILSGILSGGARLRRYPHLNLERLETFLVQNEPEKPVFVVTESIFGMDGDCPDLQRLADLRENYGFVLVLDEAHALGWYGEKGAGLAEQESLLDQVDILVGTLGKTLGSQGAFSIFREPVVKHSLENFSGEFVYSTYLSPGSAAAASRAIDLAESLSLKRVAWRKSASSFRTELISEGLKTIDGDSPVVPIILGEVDTVLRGAENLQRDGIKVAAIRPPTVPEGAARLRLSLKADLPLEGLATRMAKALK